MCREDYAVINMKLFHNFSSFWVGLCSGTEPVVQKRSR